MAWHQLFFYLLLSAGLFLFCIWDYKIFYTVLTFILCGFYGLVVVFRLLSVKAAYFGSLLGWKNEHQVDAVELEKLDESQLPSYTILVPMYKEPEVAQKVMDAVTTLDYPMEKLDVKVLLEEDDPQTRAKIDEVMHLLPPCVEVIVCPSVPKGEPKTKPRACNWGLERAKGEYLVIYDAEDRPEPDQLKKAVCVFNRLKTQKKNNVVCLQAKLNYFNAHQNVLTRYFTLEYTNWFDLFLPGLHAFRIPIPLGGTSNHFHTATLKRLGGWDPFNVTEDCDLGIRMARQGLRTEVLDSTTWEEANSRVGNWIRQRSRWVKGYLQTHLVHTQNSWLAPLLLSLALFWLGHTISGEMQNPQLSHIEGGIRLLSWLAWGLSTLAGVLFLRALYMKVMNRLGSLDREGRLSFYDAMTFRLTVGGLSGMLLLNFLFWGLTLAYLVHEPLAKALPASFDQIRIESLDGKTPREILMGWQLQYENVTQERFSGYTLWNVVRQKLSGQLNREEAMEIMRAIDIWSFWSQLLYPVVIGLFLANIVFVLLGLVSCGKRNLWSLVPYALTMPLYWVLISIAALKGGWQLFSNPWYWEKTMHGFAHPPAVPPPAQSSASLDLKGQSLAGGVE